MLDYLEYSFYKGSTTVFHVFTMITWIRGSEKIYILEFESHVVLKLFKKILYIHGYTYL
jgi:hypothetical protein